MTVARKNRGRAAEGTDRNSNFRLSVYCRMEIRRLTPANPNQTCGRPGKKNSMAVVFQLAISQAWCQRNSSGMVRTKKRTATTARVADRKSTRLNSSHLG